MTRAFLLMEGPSSKSEYCEGCPLYESTRKNGDSCPYFGDAYRETEGENSGLLCRPEECKANEQRMTNHLMTSAAKRLRNWALSPFRDVQNRQLEAMREARKR